MDGYWLGSNFFEYEKIMMGKILIFYNFFLKRLKCLLCEEYKLRLFYSYFYFNNLVLII